MYLHYVQIVVYFRRCKAYLNVCLSKWRNKITCFLMYALHIILRSSLALYFKQTATFFIGIMKNIFRLFRYFLSFRFLSYSFIPSYSRKCNIPDHKILRANTGIRLKWLSFLLVKNSNCSYIDQNSFKRISE